MPQVKSRTKSTRGREVKCGRCGRTIAPGESYYRYEFRYGGKHYRCAEHFPRQSELTQSKMSTVYAAQEDFDDNVGDLTAQGEAEEAVNAIAEAAREVAEEYSAAAEQFGQAGENQERADACEGFADELESLSVPDPSDFEVDSEDDGEEVVKQDGTLIDLAAWREAVREEVASVELAV